jgi:hypothetical protein
MLEIIFIPEAALNVIINVIIAELISVHMNDHLNRMQDLNTSECVILNFCNICFQSSANTRVKIDRQIDYMRSASPVFYVL